jgi:hypothetical protein
MSCSQCLNVLATKSDFVDRYSPEAYGSHVRFSSIVCRDFTNYGLTSIDGQILYIARRKYLSWVDSFSAAEKFIVNGIVMVGSRDNMNHGFTPLSRTRAKDHLPPMRSSSHLQATSTGAYVGI